MKYELLYIIAATKTDAEVGVVKDQVTALVTKYGEAISRDELVCKLKFAYPIEHVRYGHYAYVLFASDTQHIKELDEELRHSHDVLRHVICKASPGADERPVVLTEYEMPDVFAKRRAPRKRSDLPPSKAPRPDSKPMTEKELDEKIDKILEEDIKKL